MDDLVGKLENSFQVTKSDNSIYAPHPSERLSQFKTKTPKAGDQNVRRARYLEIQKNKRFDYKNHARKLALDQWSDGEDDDEDSEPMEVKHVKPPRRYANQLMLSEWMVEKPVDFESEWLMKVCPIGKRNLVIASRGQVYCYTRSGFRLFSFVSKDIPGGSRDSVSGFTVLDCIFSEKDKTFYILDVMCWNQQAFYDCETDFRFFWLTSKFKEVEDGKVDIDKNTNNSSYNFKQIEYVKCNNEVLINFLNSYDVGKDNVDGLLFYHRTNHYTFGTTPLVLWLKPKMLNDMFKLKFSEQTDLEM